MRDTESQHTVKYEFEHFLLQKMLFRSIRSRQNKLRPNLYERKFVGAKVISNQGRNDGNCLIFSLLSLFLVLFCSCLQLKVHI